VGSGLIASAHGVYRGGLAVHLAMVAMGGNLGLQVDARRVPAADPHRTDTLLFSESAGRFIVTVDPVRRRDFEALFTGCPCACIGTVSAEPVLRVEGLDGAVVISAAVADLKASWKRPFGNLI
jgi:phosphoribosylformylglycinamidine (FGAM) synthase-like enzyme